LGKQRRINPSIRVGHEIKERILRRNSDDGGIFTEILGVQGSGKTSLMLSLADEVMSNYPDEIIIWKDSPRSQCQFTRFDKWHIFVEEGMNMKFRDVDTDQYVNVPMTLFSTFNEFMDLAKPGQLNVIYLKDNPRYIEFIGFLRLYKGWQTLFIEEYEDIAPQDARKEEWEMVQKLAFEFKHIRKGLLSVFCNTQKNTDVYWKVRNKVMARIYLHGSKVDGDSPIDQHAVNSLIEDDKHNKRWMWMDYGQALYGKGWFRGYPPKKPTINAVDLNETRYV